MKFWQRIKYEVRQGENLELYMIVIVSVVLLLLDLFGFANPDWISSVTISVLALLAVAILGNRHKLENIEQQFSQSPHTLFLEKYPDELKEQITNARELWVIGINLATTTHVYYDSFLDSLKRGNKIRVLLINPQSHVNQLAATRTHRKQSAEWHRSLVLQSLTLLCQLRAEVPNGIEIRTLHHLPSFGMFGIDLETQQGILYLEHYGYRLKIGDKPKMVLRPQDGKWYDIFRQQLYALWQDSVEWAHSVEETQNMIIPMIRDKSYSA